MAKQLFLFKALEDELDKVLKKDICFSWNDKISKKIFKSKANCPMFSSRKCSYISNFLFIIALLSTIPVLITAWRVHSSGDSGGLVLPAIFLSVFISIVWTVYAVSIIRNFIVISSSCAMILSNLILVYVVYKARKNDKKKDGDECCD